MSTDTDDSLGERVANIEGTTEQMDKRLDDLSARMNERFDTLEGQINRVDDRIDRLDGKVGRVDRRIDETRRDIRNWLVLVVLSVSAVLTLVTVVVQLTL